MKIETKTFRIEGMSCASCVKKVETAIEHQPGVQSISVNLASETASISFDNEQVQIEQLQNRVAQVGYRMKPKDQSTPQESFWNTNQDLILVILSAVLSLPLVLPMVGGEWSEQLTLSPIKQLLLSLPVQFGIGSRFYKHSWRAVLNRSLNMDVLVAVGTSAAFGLSIYGGFFTNYPHDHLYFESGAVIITLVLLGKYLEKRAKQKTTEALRALDSLRPETATVLRQGQEKVVPIFKVIKGDLVILKPGERVPVDGKILEGNTTLDESLITGESLPVAKGPSDKVISGSLNIEGFLKIEAQSVESESMLSQIIRLMEDAHSKKAPIQKMVDRVSEIFVPAVITISFLTLIAWKLYGASTEISLVNAISVLVIACPCALGLATPTALMVGRGLAAKKGILIKDAEALEKAYSIKAVIFDKTGTLTEGQPQLMETVISGDTNLTAQELLQIAFNIQNNNTHPLARAITAKAGEMGLIPVGVTQSRIIPGKGSEGQINNGDLIQIGSLAWMIELGYHTSSLDQHYLQTLKKGFSATWIANATTKTILGYQSFADKIKPDSWQAIQDLHSMGLQTILLSGDKKEVAELVALDLKIDTVIAEVQPKEKLSHLLELRKKFGAVAMVGDGINDAPALAAADLGIAMGEGTDVAIGAAAITLMKSSPTQVVQSIKVARATYAKLKQNLFWAFIYNAIGIPLACFGLLNPMLAAAAMAFSSVSVVGNSIFLARTKD